MEKIRIIRVIARMNVGGPAVQIDNLMKHLPQTEFEQLLVTGNCDESEKDYLNEADPSYQVKRISSLGRRISVFHDIKALLDLRKVIREFDPHIIHTHTAKAGLIGRLAADLSFRRVKKVHTFHGHLLTGYFGEIKSKALVILEKLLADRTDVLVAVGNKVRQDLLASGIGNPNNFFVVKPGFDFVNDSTGYLEDLKSSRNLSFQVIWIGRMVKVKAPQRVLEIARRLRELNGEVDFVMVGGGPSLEEIEALVAEEALPIKTLGWRSDVSALLRECHILILTSLNEGTPISIIEAQKLGKPVIATDVGSVSETISVDKSGFALPYSADEFAQLIMRFGSDEILYNEFSVEAKRYAGQEFSLNRFIADYQELYRRLLN